MREINAEIMAQLESGELRPFYLIDMEIYGSHYRYTDCDAPLVYDGETYEPRGFEIEPIRYSTNTIVDEARMSMENLDEIMTSLFVGGTPQGAEVTVMLVMVERTLAS